MKLAHTGVSCQNSLLIGITSINMNLARENRDLKAYVQCEEQWELWRGMNGGSSSDGVVLPSGVPIARHHVPMLALHLM